MLNLALALSAKVATGGGAAGVVYDADAQTYFTAMTAQPDATRKGHLNTLIAGLKTDGIWTKLDWLCLLASHDAQSALLNAKNVAKTLAAVNAPTFTTDRGYTGDGTTSYLTFGEVANAAGNSYALNSASFGVWANTSGGTGVKGQMGTLTTNGTIRVLTIASAGNETFKMNDLTASILQANVGTRAGHRCLTRTASGTKRGFYNGTKVSGDVAVTSTSITAENLVCLKADTSFCNDRMAATYSGGGLTDAEAGNLHTRLSTYLTAIGAN